MQYRPDIYGLRTIAIVPVLIYHLKIPVGAGLLLPGGFLGVDVFFVLSGYLITALLLHELDETGRVDIWDFYQRRARRILPALMLVIFATLVAGWWLLLPSEMERLALSALAALGFVSNLYWYFELGQYGAQSGLLQPLLHTWSLAIEEQFYLVLPLVLWALVPTRRPRRALWALAALTLLSLILSEANTQINREMSFFSPLSRAWELLAGTLLALVVAKMPRFAHAQNCLPPALARGLPMIALGVLFVCMALIDLPQIAHPGLATLPVVLATLVLIWSAQPDERVTQMLSSAPMVRVGKLSYSLYLWHFPVFAYGRLISIDTPGPAQMAAWVGLTVALSVAGYYLVERPCRFTLRSRTLAQSGMGALVALAGAIWIALDTDIAPRGRTMDLAKIYGSNQFDNEALQQDSWALLDKKAGPDEAITTANAGTPSQDELTRLWFPTAQAGTQNMLILGNSHSKDLFNALYLAQDQIPEFAFARFGMATEFPEDQRAALYASPNFGAADIVMISTRYGKDFENRLPGLIHELTARGKQVALVGNTPEFISPGTLPIFDWYLRRTPQSGQDPARLAGMNRIARKSQVSAVTEMNARLRDIAVQAGITYLDRGRLVCPPQEDICTLVTPEGLKTMYDYGHWTLDGADWFGRQAAETGWLDPLLRRSPLHASLTTCASRPASPKGPLALAQTLEQGCPPPATRPRFWLAVSDNSLPQRRR